MGQGRVVITLVLAPRGLSRVAPDVQQDPR
jgi:hypothetical protein